MKQLGNKILMIFTILLIFAGQASAGSVTINSVNVSPVQPLNTDLITFNISGGASSGSSHVEYDLFSQNATSLLLTLYVSTGEVTVPSVWTYSKGIQPLVPATYNLEIKAFYYELGTLEDTYNVDFTVVPEPCTLALWGLGLPFLRSFVKRKD